MNNTFYTRIQNKIDTLENFTTNNPLILKGETVLVKDGDKIKIKVGIEDSAYFNDVPYVLQNPIADWTQNDSTSSDYIKNRTHWVSTGLVDILPECELVADDPENLTGEFYITQSFDEIIAGNVYTVTYNKIDYTLTAQLFAQEGLTASTLGDMGIMTGSPTGEAPFIMICVPPNLVAATGGICAIVVDPTCPASITISIKYEGEIVHQLDSKYIKDMYYTEIKEPGFVLPLVTLEMSNSQTYLSGTMPLPVTLGETYTVTFNGEEYQCVATEFNENIPVAIGNKSIAFGGEDTGEPFVVFIPTLESSSQNGYSAFVFVQDSSLTSVTLSIKDTGIIIHKVPEEYLPKGLVKEENVTDLVKLHNSLELKDTGKIGLSSSYINTINDASSQSTINKRSINVLDRNVSGLESNLTTTNNNLTTLSGSVNDIKTQISKLVGESTSGKEFTIDEETVTGMLGAEIFNDYDNNKAVKYYAHAEGENTTAYERGSHAEGYLTVARGMYSHAEGYNTTASGARSHAEGCNTTASEADSHAEGSETTASGITSHAEGDNTTASGYSSHAEGDGTTASNTGAHAEGRKTVASSPYAHAEGSFTIAASRNQHVQGKFNLGDSSNTYAHIIGNGTSDTDRSNAHTVDWDGNAWYAKEVYVGGTDQNSGEKLIKQSDLPAIDSTLSNSGQVADAKATGDAINALKAEMQQSLADLRAEILAEILGGEW